jgi:N-acetylglucosaminyldiphosphoundecaprenol N-acetyl-beta-D-mannosaminyltransferase
MIKKGGKKWLGEGKVTQKVNSSGDVLDGNMWQMFSTTLFGRDVSMVLKIIGDKLTSGTKKYWIATVNPEFVMEAEKDAKFKEILRKTDLNVVDGIGLIWARELERRKGNKWLNGFKVGIEVLKGKHRDQIASGADLIVDLVEMAAKNDLKVFFLGGFEDRAERTADFFESQFSMTNDQLGWCEGEPDISNDRVLEQVNKFKPDVLFVAYGMKKQEFWINKNLENLNVGVVMGVGRSFDYYSGDLKRAPEVWRKVGMEWFYSLVKEPKRLKRQLVLPKFVWKVLTK